MASFLQVDFSKCKCYSQSMKTIFAKVALFTLLLIGFSPLMVFSMHFFSPASAQTLNHAQHTQNMAMDTCFDAGCTLSANESASCLEHCLTQQTETRTFVYTSLITFLFAVGFFMALQVFGQESKRIKCFQRNNWSPPLYLFNTVHLRE